MTDLREKERDLELHDIIEAQKRITDALEKLYADDPDRPPTGGEKIADAVVAFIGSWAPSLVVHR